MFYWKRIDGSLGECFLGKILIAVGKSLEIVLNFVYSSFLFSSFAWFQIDSCCCCCFAVGRVRPMTILHGQRKRTVRIGNCSSTLGERRESYYFWELLIQMFTKRSPIRGALQLQLSVASSKKKKCFFFIILNNKVWK